MKFLCALMPLALMPLALMPLALMVVSPASAESQRITGNVTVVDGDTLDFSGQTIRLFGIDAPEAEQECARDGIAWRCGEEAAAFLTELVGSGTVVCQSRESGMYGLQVAICNRGDLDLGLTMIEAGLAITLSTGPYPYTKAEAIRKAHRIGLWGSQFQPPVEWRALHQGQAAPAAREQRPDSKASRKEPSVRNRFGCAIKGNRNRKGEWIYHLPGRPYYAQTRAEELFCTESDARKAGYRRSKA